MMLTDPSHKYAAQPRIALPDRQWPERALTAAPIWLSTDLRDGNQALFEPMDSQRKLRLFRLLCDIGCKQIEVAFPAASKIEYDFVRELIEGEHVPDDVTIGVLTQARAPLIERTLQSLRGARRAIVHVYNATSRPFREIVFGMGRDQVVRMATDAVEQICELTAQQPATEWLLEYSPETFSATEPEFALEICDAVTAAWGAAAGRPVILNLPATVECATPNVYADQIEWMHRHLARREYVVLSVHPHNDRGTAVAAAELALMAGAQRVEGCLFGHGERTGNVDLVTLALNLYSQGIAPGLDFSSLHAVARTVEDVTGLPVAPRHPYAGDLVFTAFSGSHQEAIRKGMARQQAHEPWQVPYLPVDPADLGCSYASVIRVNSQSGKGGVAWLLEAACGIRLPRRLQIEFAASVQQHLDEVGGEIDGETLWQLFRREYLTAEQPLRLGGYQCYGNGTRLGIRMTVDWRGCTSHIAGEGNGPIDAAVAALRALGIEMRVHQFESHALSADEEGAAAQACVFIEAAVADSSRMCYGVGIDANSTHAAISALTSACNRLHAVMSDREVPTGVVGKAEGRMMA